jgi:hypothetical protein
MMLRKQTPQPQTPLPAPASSVAAAARAIGEKTTALRSLLRDEIHAVIALEKSRAVATEPPDPETDIEGAARGLLNGSSYEAGQKTTRSPGVELFLRRRKVEVIRRAIEIGEKQSHAAGMDLGREVLAEHDAEIRALHRRRALAVVGLMKINDDIEALRLRLLESGGIVSHELDGYTLRLFGHTGQATNQFNNWPKKYLDVCLASGVITTEDLNP